MVLAKHGGLILATKIGHSDACLHFTDPDRVQRNMRRAFRNHLLGPQVPFSVGGGIPHTLRRIDCSFHGLVRGFVSLAPGSFCSQGYQAPLYVFEKKPAQPFNGDSQ